MMYTWIVKNAIDLAEQFRVLGLLRNNIFLDKAYELSTYLSKAYWSNKKIMINSEIHEKMSLSPLSQK